jgi:hypothetical protein
MITDISQLDIKRLARRQGSIKTPRRTIKETSYSDVSANIRMMETYRQDWDSLEEFRERYRRVCKFHRGDQWSDKTVNDEGQTVTEETYIQEQGKLPLKQNIIRPLAKSLEGLFRSERGKSIVISRKPDSAKIEKMLSNAIQYVLQINEAKEIDPRTFDIFILSGLPIQKAGYDFIDKYGRYDVVIDYIDGQYMFFNTDIKDVRLNDLRRIGQLHDITLDELYVHFAKTNEDKEILRDLYRHITKDELITEYGLSADRAENLDFYIPNEPHICRVIEVWEKKAVDVIEYWDQADGSEGIWDGTLNEIIEINQLREVEYEANEVPEDKRLYIIYDTSVAFKWFYKYLTPYGHVLREGETPYDHGMHPYIMYPYPLINGEVWGPIEDVIDQQKYINRLITLWDFIMGTSAKNTAIFDKNSAKDYTPEELATKYREVGGVILLDLKPGVTSPPFELGGRLPQLGITELIGMQLKWMQDISGVQPASQGQPGGSGTPATRYAMEIQQTNLNSRDLMESFASFRKWRDMKVLKTIIQFYRTKRYLAISGKDEDQLYDPVMVKDSSDYDLVIAQSMDSPTYKNWMDEMLKEFVMNGLIDMEMFLTHSNLPFADALLEDLRNKKEQMAQGQISPQDAVQGISQNFNQQAQNAGVDMNNMNQVIGMMNPKRNAA